MCLGHQLLLSFAPFLARNGVMGSVEEPLLPAPAPSLVAGA